MNAEQHSNYNIWIGWVVRRRSGASPGTFRATLHWSHPKKSRPGNNEVRGGTSWKSSNGGRCASRARERERERERVASFVWGCTKSVGFGGPRVVFVMSRGKKRSVAGGIDSSSHFFGCFEIMESVAHKTKESKCQTWICHWIRLRKNDARRRQLRVSS